MPAKKIIDDVCGRGVDLCVVTKNQGIEEIDLLLRKYPQIKIIGENRWPECEEKFRLAEEKFPGVERHFIGRLQGNKVTKIVPLVDMIQSVDSIKLLGRIDFIAGQSGKVLDFCFQVNVSEDDAKSGLDVKNLESVIEEYLAAGFKNVELKGLMTMGEAALMDARKAYFTKLKKIFDDLNEKYFSERPLRILSMGTSDDYLVAMECGATMVRIGRGIMVE